MNVIDLPEPANHALYDEAITQYAELVRSRARAVYHVGYISEPGLSHIDLVVVTDRTGIDNRYYYSALHRLPRRFHPLFEHEPFILPVWSLRVVQYTTHTSRALIAGRDLLHCYAPIDSNDERWCRVLEAYCWYAWFAAKVRESDILKGRLTLTVANAFGHTLRDAELLVPAGSDWKTYAGKIDAIRAGFFERADRVSGILDTWHEFNAAFARFDSQLRAWLGADDAQAAVAKARVLLRGEESCEEFDREYAFRRARDINGYHFELASLRFPYGHLFHVAAYPGAVRRLPDAPVITNLVRNIYRVRRRLTEYAAKA